MYWYLASVAVSSFTLMINLVKIFTDAGDLLFTDTKTYICMAIAVALMVIGIIREERYGKTE